MVYSPEWDILSVIESEEEGEDILSLLSLNKSKDSRGSTIRVQAIVIIKVSLCPAVPSKCARAPVCVLHLQRDMDRAGCSTVQER